MTETPETPKEPMYCVNGKEYPVPTSINLGEMCDAEQFFGVEFGDEDRSGMRMAAALLWIALRRAEEDVTPDDVRALDMDVFKKLPRSGVRPPAVGKSESDGSSGENSESDTGTALNPQPSGVPS